ncbi:hypothetical protein ACFVRB_43835 [Streptomyces nojiriensis]|uniref:hypothetical protein n=1 Tax=Streptomyces nojiriensis TaxID=66374 RepID=UPI0036D80F8D
MSTATDAQPQPPQQPQLPGMDPVVTLLLVLVVALVLGAAGYVCVAHPSLIGPITAVAAALAAVFGVVAVRRR